MKSDENSWISATPTGDSTKLDENTKLLVNMVFTRFKSIYGHKFESTYGDSASLDLARREWAYCIQGYSEPQLARALHESKLKYAWPPAIAEFVALLRPSPEELGLPSTLQAYHEACRCRQDPRTFAWTHPIIFHATQAVSLWRIQHSSEKDVWPLFEKEYNSLLDRMYKGEQFTIPDLPEIEDKSTVTQAITIQELAEKFELDASAFYYMALIKGSPVRNQFRNKLLKKHPELEGNIPE